MTDQEDESRNQAENARDWDLLAMNVFEASHLCRVYRHRSGREFRALDDISISIPQGAFVVVTGPSGSGKSTLLSLLGLLDHPTSGQLSFSGCDVNRCSGFELARCRRRIGFVFQEYALLPGLDLLDNVSYPLVPRGVTRRSRREKAAQWLERLQLLDHRAKGPEGLSGGERQRVALARALIGEPEVVLADEPTSSLDEEKTQQVSQILQDYHAAGNTVVLATHQFAQPVGDALILTLADGKLSIN